LVVDCSASDDREVYEDDDGEKDASSCPYSGKGVILVIVTEGADGSADGGVNDDLEEGEGSADSVGVEGKRGRSGEETVHDIVRVRSEADEKEKFWAALNSTDDTLDRRVGIEPRRDGGTEERAREGEDEDGAREGGEVGDEGADPGAVGVARQEDEGGVEREGSWRAMRGGTKKTNRLTDGGEEDEEEEDGLAVRVGGECGGEAVEDCVGVSIGERGERRD